MIRREMRKHARKTIRLDVAYQGADGRRREGRSIDLVVPGETGLRTVPDRQNSVACIYIDYPRNASRKRLTHPCGDTARPIGRNIAVHSPTSGHLDNKLLAALPRSQFNLLVPHLTVTSMAQGVVTIEGFANDDENNNDPSSAPFVLTR